MDEQLLVLCSPQLHKLTIMKQYAFLFIFPGCVSGRRGMRGKIRNDIRAQFNSPEMSPEDP